MTAEEAKRKSKERPYTIENFKSMMKNVFQDKGDHALPNVFLCPAGVYYSETFVQDVVKLGYKIQEKEDMMGINYYLISW